MSSDALVGGCQCGAIRYGLSRGPLRVYVCHCTECRKQSASAFGISFVVPQTALHVIQGEPKFWSRPTATGNTLDCAFCAECGSRLWHQRRGSTDRLNIKGGSLDKPVDLRQAVHIWTSSMLPGIILPPGAVQFSGEPNES
jgi:hypothetical protein